MTFEKIKQNLVEEQKVMTFKELVKLAINLSLFIIGICLIFSVATYRLLGMPFTIIVILMSVFAYNWSFDWITEDATIRARFIKFTKFWIIPYILLVIVILVLKYWNFM